MDDINKSLNPYVSQFVGPSEELKKKILEESTDYDEKLESVLNETKDEADEERNVFNRILAMIEFFTPSPTLNANRQEYHRQNNEMLKSILYDRIAEIGEKAVAKIVSDNYGEVYLSVDRAQHESGTHASYKGLEVHPAITRFAEILKGAPLDKEDYDSLERIREEL